MSAPKLVCLLPARNCESDLPGYFESVERFADTVVALDDGSTDATRDVLAAHPRVEVVLSNPARQSYRGWDDLANRSRLLAAAAELEPDWIVSLDADERIAADDAAALRAFVDTDALPGCAYVFKVFRMHEDLARYEGTHAWVARLFAFEAGQTFDGQRLHFVPVPTSIPRKRWFRTTIRIQHLGSQTEERRRARFGKYAQADPAGAHHPDYRKVLWPLDGVRPWEPRPRDLPVLMGPARHVEQDFDVDGPILSAIVISQNDERTIERTVRSIVEQELPAPFEVIVVTSGTDRTAAIVRERFPQVRLVELKRPALPGAARNAGLRVARGEYISFPGSHVELPPGSLAARLRAHELGYGMVSGVVVPGTQTRAGWASHLLDQSARLPGRPSGPVAGAPPACSYARELLHEVGPFRDDVRAGEDTRVNYALARRGYKAYFSNEVSIIHHTPCRTTLDLVRHKFVRGRALAALLHEQHEAGGPSPRRVLRGQVRRRISRSRSNIQRWGGDLERTYRRVFPLVVVAALAMWVGAWYELLRPARSRGARAPQRGGWKS
jgi:glycosyltransferase involved in cell wall biosynthesis